MIRDPSDQGHLIRRFTVLGEDTIYRERLTWFSDSERTMKYCHLAGISGVEYYDAELVIEPTSTGASITLRATFSASEARANEIAAGTRAIFDQGTSIIAELAEKSEPLEVISSKDTPGGLQTVQVGGAPKITLDVAGQENDTLCLFLHGIGGNRSNWHSQITMCSNYCQVAAMDLRGYGQSELGSDPTTIDDYCSDIVRVVRTMGAKRLVLCGLSYGAWIATSFAMRHPNLLSALIVSGGCTGMSEASAVEREAFRTSREVPMSEGKTPADFAPSVVDIIAGPSAGKEVRTNLLNSMKAIPSRTYADALHCFTSPPERFEFAKITTPILLVTGEHDRLAPPSEIKSVAEKIFDASPNPDVRFEVVADAGHVCNLEKPDAYNTILLDFLHRVQS